MSHNIIQGYTILKLCLAKKLVGIRLSSDASMHLTRPFDVKGMPPSMRLMTAVILLMPKRIIYFNYVLPEPFRNKVTQIPPRNSSIPEPNS